jgi:hypothetical protein
MVERSVFEGGWPDDVGLDPSPVSVEVGEESVGVLELAAADDVLGEGEYVSSGLALVLELAAADDVLGEEESVSTGLVRVLELAAANDVSEETELEIVALAVEF